ncbi:AzlD domain-containing protein [Burkholderia gladioli]|uniref:AzlD domain-containing protein n=1 Tax=Burkholderia gladioli TaxID=28095 RepID=UPI00163E2D55|nr:AzlD domain-containing protein [Burkholderia gladioli]
MQILNQWLSIAVMSGITIMLRAAPLVLSKSRLRSPWVLRLNRDLPLCVMVVLISHSISGNPSPAWFLLTEKIGALCVVATSYLKWRNALLSVVAGIATLSAITRIL